MQFGLSIVKPMGQLIKRHINANSVLVMVVGSLVTVAIGKIDKTFTAVTRLEDKQIDQERRIGNIESFVGIFLPKPKKDIK